jgi:hypothetical protein
MPSQWYFMKGEEKCGPVHSKVLRTLAEAGQLEATDLVWKDGLSKWKPAGEIKGLFADVSSGVNPTASSHTVSDSAEVVMITDEESSPPSDLETIGTALKLTIGCIFVIVALVLIWSVEINLDTIPGSVGIAIVLIAMFVYAIGQVLLGIDPDENWAMKDAERKQNERLANLDPVKCNSCGHVGTLAAGDENKTFGSDWKFHRVCAKCGSENWVRVKEDETSS